MSQMLKHIKWCLDKAEKELREGKKHKGLIKINPDINKAKKHLNKAQHNLDAVEYFKEEGKINIDNKFIAELKHGLSDEAIVEISEGLQYGVETKTKEAILKRLKDMCSEIIDITKD